MTVAAKKAKSNSEYNSLLEKLDDIPTLPMVAMKVNELINDPTSSSSDIAELLKKDQVLTAKILRLANSSYYAIPGGVNDVQKALAFLGFNTLAQLVLGLSVVSLFQSEDSEEFTMTSFWKHALGTAVCSEQLAKRLDIGSPEEAFTCGLLHDVGKLVLHEIDPNRLDSIVKAARERKVSFLDVEREWELPGHSFLGEVIATKWGLPLLIRNAIRYHHFDVSSMDSIIADYKPIIHVVRLANTICVKNQIGNSGDYSEGSITEDMLIPLELKVGEISEIEEKLLKDMERAGAFLSAYS